MDNDLLVEKDIEDGRRLIAGLLDRRFDVSVALWVKTSEEGLWFLYIGTNSLQTMGLGASFRIAYEVLSQIPHTAITISNIKIIVANNPIAVEAMEIRDRYPARLATRYNGTKLGNMMIDEAYIYPGGGEMTRTEILQTVTGLMNRQGVLTPSSITLRDGTRMQAVPVSIQMRFPGAIQIVLHDVVADLDRSLSVDDVVSIS